MIKVFLASLIAILLLIFGTILNLAEDVGSAPSETLPAVVTPSTEAETETESSAISPQKIEEIKKEYWYFYEKDNYLFLGEINYNFVKNNYRDEGLECRLLSTDGDFDESIIIVDKAYANSLYYYFEEIPQKVECEIDTDEKTVLITAYKNNYFLDFNAKSVTYEEKYRVKDLQERRPRDISPDGAFEIYVTEDISGGESFWGDLVALEVTTNDIWYLNETGNGYINAIFIDNNTLLVVNADNIYLHDLSRRTTSTSVPQFEFGVSAERENSPFYYIIGAAYDREAKETILAYRETDGDGTFETIPTHTLYLAVFDDTGNLVKQFDTGFMIQPWDFALFLNKAEINLKGAGKAELSVSFNDENSKDSTIILGEVDYRK